MAKHTHRPPGSASPVIDEGTFVGSRIGGPGHPVFWAWKPADGTDREFHAIYKAGDAVDGFIRPAAASVALGYQIVCVMDPLNPGVSLQHTSVGAFEQWVRGIALGCGMDPGLIRIVCSCPLPAHVPGDAIAVLDAGLFTVRATPNPMDPVIAMALCEPGAFTEHWRTSTNLLSPYNRPSAMNQTSELWFWGAPPIPAVDLDPWVMNQLGEQFLAPTFGTYDA